MSLRQSLVVYGKTEGSVVGSFPSTKLPLRGLGESACKCPSVPPALSGVTSVSGLRPVRHACVLLAPELPVNERERRVLGDSLGSMGVDGRRGTTPETNGTRNPLDRLFLQGAKGPRVEETLNRDGGGRRMYSSNSGDEIVLYSYQCYLSPCFGPTTLTSPKDIIRTDGSSPSGENQKTKVTKDSIPNK